MQTPINCLLSVTDLSVFKVGKNLQLKACRTVLNLTVHRGKDEL